MNPEHPARHAQSLVGPERPEPEVLGFAVADVVLDPRGSVAGGEPGHVGERHSLDQSKPEHGVGVVHAVGYTSA